MKTVFYFVLGFLMLFVSNARSQQVISSTGGTGQNANGTLCYTLGELVIDSRIAGSTTITQGFHQTKLDVTSVKELQNLGFTVIAFPNPTNDFITIKVENGNPQKMSFALFDVNGKLIKNGTLLNREAEISFISLSPDTYILKVLRDGKEIKTLKIVKQ